MPSSPPRGATLRARDTGHLIALLSLLLAAACNEQPEPPTEAATAATDATEEPPEDCHASYPDFCIPPPPPDLG